MSRTMLTVIIQPTFSIAKMMTMTITIKEIMLMSIYLVDIGHTPQLPNGQDWLHVSWPTCCLIQYSSWDWAFWDWDTNPHLHLLHLLIQFCPTLLQGQLSEGYYGCHFHSFCCSCSWSTQWLRSSVFKNLLMTISISFAPSATAILISCMSWQQSRIHQENRSIKISVQKKNNCGCIE